ncbi:hypothetical protein Mapa_003316 [Marchantia paleacea]|nr:hypothetical protein Mapa_003316 [Marchantia paleacea]
MVPVAATSSKEHSLRISLEPRSLKGILVKSELVIAEGDQSKLTRPIFSRSPNPSTTGTPEFDEGPAPSSVFSNSAPFVIPAPSYS